MRPTIRHPAVALLLTLLAVGPPATASSDEKARALDVARAHLTERAPELGLQASDLEELVVTDTYTTKHNQVTHIYLRQALGGIALANGRLTLNLDRDGRLLSAGNRFVAGLSDRVETTRPLIDREAAMRRAADGLGLAVVEPVVLIDDLGGPAREALFGPAGISLDPITIKLAYYATPGGAVRLSWEMLIRQTDQKHWWHLWLDAATGEILAKVDWIAQDSYQALEIPLEDPGEDGDPLDEDRTIILDPADPTASPFGWHDTDGDIDPDFTDTRGNNVNAQEDRDGNSMGGTRPSGGASLDFAAAMDLSTQAPADYTDAAIINLFYWNNIMHDVLYQYGFDEPAGNFQANNYGNGGLGVDAVEADAQDGSGTGNANFATPPDGLAPRMQMFEWLANPDLTVNSPATIAGTYAAAGADFGAALDVTGVTGDLEVVSDGTADPSEGCNALVGFTSGKIALIDRGNCQFGTKVLNAENAGAIAAVVVNNAGDGLITMGEGAQGRSVTISSLFIGQSDGDTIKGKLPTPGVNVTLATSGLDRDSDLDNGIIAHEYCHGLSNRLTGGPSTASCLSGDQRAGEGWSDWCTLFFGAK
ncbi:MAG: M36 family metallopeptidase, partial [Thermoanaerobaculia bacterium]